MLTTLITGANRGVGLAMTRQMAARGDQVFACARRPETSRETIKGVTNLTLDVTDEASLKALSARLDGEALDLLVCNAGALIGRGGIADETYTHAAFAEVLAVNVTGVFMTVRACLPALRRGKSGANGGGAGKIAVISSRMGSTAQAKGSAYLYRASKAAATNLAACLAEELAAEGVAVAAYHPGWVRTDMGGDGADISPEESAAGLIERFDELTLETAGQFRFYSGEPIPF